MALELVTGYWGQNHVTAEQEADLNAGIFGSGFYVLRVGEKMRAEAVTSNQVRIFDGIFVGYGRQASIEEGGYENVTIENGTAGLLRNDMIVIKYNKDEESGIESVAFDVLKGQTGSIAQDPVPNNQDIRAGAFESEMPLYRVRLNGLAIEEIEPLFTVPKSIEELMQENAALNSALEDKQDIYYTSIAPAGEAPFAANKNMVLISQYLDGENNKSGYFSINDNNRSEWKGLSGLMPQSGDFIGFREVYVKQGTPGTEHIMAKITEMYPLCGRQYFNFYNHGSWVGWTVIAPAS